MSFVKNVNRFYKFISLANVLPKSAMLTHKNFADANEKEIKNTPFKGLF